MKAISTAIFFCCVMLIGVTSYAQRYDVAVSPGKSIQAAIEGAPQTSTKPYIIFIKNGVYNEKVIIDRPNIVLLGENRDSTRLIYAELATKRTMKEYKGKPELGQTLEVASLSRRTNSLPKQERVVMKIEKKKTELYVFH